MKLYIFEIYGCYESIKYIIIADTEEEAREIAVNKLKIDHASEKFGFFSKHNTLEYYIVNLELNESFDIKKGFVCSIYQGE